MRQAPTARRRPRWGQGFLLLGFVVTVMHALPAGSADLRWRRVADMHWRRAGHAATLLKDGRVLISGGSVIRNESAIPWAEVFDPATGTFSPTGAMSVPRVEHVSLLLPDGRVMVAGGWRAGFVVATDTSEAWDPRTGLFAMLPSLSVARGQGAAFMLLDDGRALIVGGSTEGEYGTATAAVEAFDPRTQSWSRWGDLLLSRSECVVHAVSPDRIMVFGGSPRCCGAPAGRSRSHAIEILDVPSKSSVAVLSLPDGIEVEPARCLAPSRAELVCGEPPDELVRWNGRRFEPAGDGLRSALEDMFRRLYDTDDQYLGARLLAYEILVLELAPPGVAAISQERRVTPLADGRVLLTGESAGGLGRADARAWVAERVAAPR